MSEENKAIVRRLYEAINARNMDAWDELLAADHVAHQANNPEFHGIEAYKNLTATFIDSVPDLHVTIDDMVAEGDKVAIRLTIRGTQTGQLWGGIPPTGKRIALTEIAISRVANGKQAEIWFNADDLGLMQDLGLIPAQKH